jgi:fructose-1,6-bisphosphatase/inositol monophosphatase family enzyme
MTSQEQYLKIAVDAAKKAGTTFKKNFGKPKDVQMKNNDFRNLVTEVDKAIENQIRKTIVSKFPTHKIIGEEYSKDEVGKNDLVWIIDPIDGTTNYIQGLPFCCVSIALWDNKGPLVAALFNPILNQLFTASRGHGAKLNSRPIKVSKENVTCLRRNRLDGRRTQRELIFHNGKKLPKVKGFCHLGPASLLGRSRQF